jgi:hypothetical protein
MANSSLTLSSLDFDSLKNNFKEFLKTQSVFKDYDFNGSNMNVLLDVMSYNSYLNAFYLNMVASEMFLDSAQKYDSIVSHAKELNYLPRSTRSSVGEVNLQFNTVGVSSLTVPKGTRFTGINSNGSYTFTTSESKVLTSSNTNFSVANLQVFDGDYFQDSYVVDYDIENQQFLISNRNVDISSVTVNVVENNGQSNTEFKRVDSLFGLNDRSEIFFLQGTQNNLYEVTFGDGLFGRKPLNSATIVINYRVAVGPSADGVTEFILIDNLNDSNEGDILEETITTAVASAGGAEQESIESIRFAAPRYFATQQRAITNDDYSSLIIANFGGEISDVAVYGGQEIEPKLYGRVIVSLKPAGGTVAPDYVKSNIINYLQEYIPLPNRVVITDPDYLYCSIKSEIQYDVTVTSKTSEDIEVVVRSAIDEYSSSNLEKFGNDLRYSRLISAIDNSDVSITSNDTELRIIKRISPLPNTPATYTIDVGNPFYYDSTGYNDSAQHTLIHENETDARFTHASLISSTFTYNSTDGKVYPLSFFEDDTQGNIRVYTYVGSDIIPLEKVGSIDYVNGKFELSNINIAEYSNYVSIYLRSRLKDIIANKNKIILIDQNDVNISVVETRR